MNLPKIAPDAKVSLTEAARFVGVPTLTLSNKINMLKPLQPVLRRGDRIGSTRVREAKYLWSELKPILEKWYGNPRE
jgi:hypothetical protein